MTVFQMFDFGLGSALDPAGGAHSAGTLKLQDWTLQDWTQTDGVARVDIAGLDNDGQVWQGHWRT